jgi:hypothetical protein
VPYWFARREVSVKISESLIEVFYDHQRIAVHPKASIPYRHSTLAAHMPPDHWAYKAQSKASFLAWAAQIGPHTHGQVEAIFAAKDHEEQAFRTLKGVQAFATRHGPARLEAACRHANTFALVGLKRLKAILKANLDSTPLLAEDDATPSAPHDHVRGQTYYS